ncbi:MAG: hypothetical protein ISP49_07830 [Reyranella sp.]|jgi:hypothetical protein|nr:hypothetical protein [Reyranella sp.]
MRTIFLATALVAVASIAEAQSPAAKLPGQSDPSSSATTSPTPNAGNDEVAARRKLEEQGYKDVRGLTANGDGTVSGRAVRDDPMGRWPGSNAEVNVDIDASGKVRER